MPKFAILMREDDHAWQNLSPNEQEALMKQYYAWVGKLKENKIFVSGEPLGGGGRLLRAADGEVVDGPFTETKEVLTGFFIIEAADLDAAAAIAKECPALTHGETVELRPVGHD